VKLVEGHAQTLGVSAACVALSVPRATFYRRRHPATARPPRPTPARALSADERRSALVALHEPRFVDKAPAEVYATLLDEGRYLCSERTMYRLLAASGELRERRDVLRHKNHPKPELLATRPNELWSWDITKLHGPQKWTYFYLYVILDVYSRYVVGWMVAHAESSTLASKLIEETCKRQGITPDTLTVHADRGTSMKSKAVAFLLGDLGVTKSHSRPHVSNDNPFSESQFKTLKYRPDFPERFGCLQDARAHCSSFFGWYNDDHRHDGLALHTPRDVHYGNAKARTAERNVTLEAAFRAHPERFANGVPSAKEPPSEVWINKPLASADDKDAAQ
jgi:putative transposase